MDGFMVRGPKASLPHGMIVAFMKDKASIAGSYGKHPGLGHMIVLYGAIVFSDDPDGIAERLEFYDAVSLRTIVMRTAALLNINLARNAAEELARRSRGTPRIVNRLLRRVHDYAIVSGADIIDVEVTRSALKSLEIDELGLDTMDRVLLDTLIDKFDCGPVGLDTLSAATGESADSIQDVYEPFLLQQGFIQRTPRGRIATRRALEYLGKPTKGSDQGDLEV